MKRSEMIKLIEKELLENVEENYEGHFKQLADDILFITENYGMMPPFDMHLYHREWRNGENGYKWEPEDEEK